MIPTLRTQVAAATPAPIRLGSSGWRRGTGAAAQLTAEPGSSRLARTKGSSRLARTKSADGVAACSLATASRAAKTTDPSASSSERQLSASDQIESQSMGWPSSSASPRGSPTSRRKSSFVGSSRRTPLWARDGEHQTGLSPEAGRRSSRRRVPRFAAAVEHPSGNFAACK